MAAVPAATVVAAVRTAAAASAEVLEAIGCQTLEPVSQSKTGVRRPRLNYGSHQC